MITIFAAIVPYWIMAKFDHHSVSEITISQSTNRSKEVNSLIRVTQFFYLVDKIELGLIE